VNISMNRFITSCDLNHKVFKWTRQPPPPIRDAVLIRFNERVQNEPRRVS
jgi:hypothetical protein